MKKTLILIALTISTAFFATSCKNDDEVAPSAVAGSWSLQSYESEIKVKGEDSEKDGEDVSASKLFMNLAADGTFTSNSVFSVEDVVSNESISGKYEFKDGFLVLKYKDPETKADVVFYSKVKSSTSSELVLVIDKDALLKTAQASSATDPETAEGITLILLLVEKLEITFKYKKA